MPPTVRIVVLDDNRDSADSVAALLRLTGHETLALYSAHEALEQAPAYRPEVVLIDIGLPEMDGYAVAQRLREVPELAKARLVALTGYGRPEDRRRAREAGFHDHLTKPVTLERLVRSVAGVAGKTAGEV